MTFPVVPMHLVVGSFDMLHIGHVRLLDEASREVLPVAAGVLGDQLSLQLLGSIPFMPAHERAELVSELSTVERAVIVDSIDLNGLISDIGVVEISLDPGLAAAGFATGAATVRLLPDLTRSASELLVAALARGAVAPLPASGSAA